MNIRTVTNPLTQIENRPLAEGRAVKLDQSHQDRDQSSHQHQKEQDHSPLSDEEMRQAKKYLDELNSLKQSGLKVEVETIGALRFFLIREPGGQVVRRIPEFEMRQLIGDKEKRVGQIFDRAG